MGEARRMTYASEGDIGLHELRDFLNACPAPPGATVQVTINDRGNRLPKEWWATVHWPRT